MPNQTMTDQERDKFLLEPHIAVISVAKDEGRPPNRHRFGTTINPAVISHFSPAPRGVLPEKQR